MEKNISLAKNYFDFNGLNDLKNSAKKNEMKALKETATQFEALFLQMMGMILVLSRDIMGRR